MTIYTALASLHHILAFILVAALVVELFLIRPGMNAREIRRLVSADMLYGAAFLMLLVFGFARVFFGESGHLYYFGNGVFLLKMVVFALIATLSIWPTVTFFRWRSAMKLDGEFRPAHTSVRRVRGFIAAEAILLVLIPILAAMLARGYGA